MPPDEELPSVSTACRCDDRYGGRPGCGSAMEFDRDAGCERAMMEFALDRGRLIWFIDGELGT